MKEEEKKPEVVPPEAEKKPDAPRSVEPAKKANPEMEKISTYNGDSTERYNWSQGILDVVV